MHTLITPRVCRSSSRSVCHAPCPGLGSRYWLSANHSFNTLPELVTDSCRRSATKSRRLSARVRQTTRILGSISMLRCCARKRSTATMNPPAANVFGRVTFGGYRTRSAAVWGRLRRDDEVLTRDQADLPLVDNGRTVE